MFPICIQKLDNISIRQIVLLESSICGLFGNMFGFKINVRVYEKLAKKVVILLQKLRCTLQNVAARGALTATATADGQLALHE